MEGAPKMNDANVKETSDVRKKPHCSYCKNHKKNRITRQHKCPYKDKCDCILCQLTNKAQIIMRHQQRVWRFQNQKNENGDSTRFQKCDNCRNHLVFERKSNHTCPWENCTCCLCELTHKRRKIMKHIQRARRLEVTLESNCEDDEVEDGLFKISIDHYHNETSDGKEVESLLSDDKELPMMQFLADPRATNKPSDQKMKYRQQGRMSTRRRKNKDFGFKQEPKDEKDRFPSIQNLQLSSPYSRDFSRSNSYHSRNISEQIKKFPYECSEPLPGISDSSPTYPEQPIRFHQASCLSSPQGCPNGVMDSSLHSPNFEEHVKIKSENISPNYISDIIFPPPGIKDNMTGKAQHIMLDDTSFKNFGHLASLNVLNNFQQPPTSRWDPASSRWDPATCLSASFSASISAAFSQNTGSRPLVRQTPVRPTPILGNTPLLPPWTGMTGISDFLSFRCGLAPWFTYAQDFHRRTMNQSDVFANRKVPDLLESMSSTQPHPDPVMGSLGSWFFPQMER